MKRLLLVVVIVLALGALVWAFVASRKEAASEAERERPVSAPSRVSVVNGATVIKLDAATQEASGIATSKARAAEYREAVRAYGMVLDLGRLTELANSYAAAQAEVQTARAKLAASKTAFERASALYRDEQNVSLARVQAAEAAFRSDEASVAASKSRVDTLAVTARQQWGPALTGALIQRGGLVTRLLDRQDVLLQVTLPSGSALSEPPSRAEAQTGKQTRTTIRLVSRAPRTDPKIQGESFFYLASAESGLLPGMNVLVYLPSGEATGGAVVPQEAIVWWQDRAWVYMRTGSDAFTRLAIATQQPVEGGYVVKNVEPGAEMVTRGAELLLSEEFRAQIRVGE